MSLKINWSDFKGKFFVYLSLIVIFYHFFISLSAIMYVIKKNLQDKIFEYSDLLNISSEIMEVHASLLMIPIMLLFFAIIVKKIKIEHFAISVFFSFNLKIYELFDNVLHPFLMKCHVFDFVLREGQTLLNPQYTKVLVYLLLIFILSIMVFIKKYRSLDRIFILLISCSILITVFIFHMAIPRGMFKYVKYQLQEDVVKEMKELPIEFYCKDRNCFILDKDFKLKDTTKGTDLSFLNKYKYFFMEAEHKLRNNNIMLTKALGNFSGQGFDFTVASAKKYGDDYIVLLDENISKKYSRQSEIWFSFLASCAHLVWIFGGVGLLFFHKMRFERRKNKIDT